MSAVREMLLLVLIALSPAFLYPIISDGSERWLRFKSDLSKPNNQHNLIAVSCVCSLVISVFFSNYLHEYIPLSYGLVPLFAAMLYERLGNAVVLGILQLVLYLLTEPSTLPGFLLNTGVLVFPLILLSGNKFRRSTPAGKGGILSLCLLISSLLLTSAPFFLNKGLEDNFKFIAFVYLNTFIMIAIGLVLIHSFEGMLEKKSLRLQVDKLASQYYREEEKMQQMMDATPLSVILVDQEGHITGLNDNFLRFHQRKFPEQNREQLTGSYFISVLSNVGLSLEVMKNIHSVFKDKQSINGFTQQEDKTFYMSISPIVKRSSGVVSGAVIIAQDITELEMLRMELNNVDRLNLVGQMAAGITHEIRNPMSVVRGFLQLMREKSPPSLDNYYHIVLEELDRANSIINDFLSLAQNRPVHRENTSLEEIIQELAPLLWADANLRGQSVEVRLAGQLPQLELNAKEIKQLILNLCRNAMEAMEAMVNKGLLTLETRMLPEGIELLVRDTGPGMPAEVKASLFEPFFTTKPKGTGVGLSLCKNIVERHNGTIRVYSEPGAGTTFSIVFPAPSTVLR